ncbi:MAG: Mrp/NBP35 family ATP-binding protein [Candidatus Latescibacteria bacterium]|nr:Mrp/NBP35 family ATP-binding protein [Candidatus Latescibacterota bacterium]
MTAESETSRPEPSLSGVQHIIAVASGKGGVGKSTISVNLSLALSQEKKTVGLLDADIYGPNIPQMMGISKSLEKSPSGKMQPLVSHDIRLISIGFVVGTSDAIIYRGPLVGKMIKRFLDDAEWGELDYLVIDLPPGTGDASLTLAQSTALTGVVIVTTPQQVALADVRKSISMFQRLRVPILGIVENMSYYVDPQSQSRSYIFGQGGGHALSDELDLPFLGEIPLDPAVCAGGDAGKPIFLSHPESAMAEVFRQISHNITDRISQLARMDKSDITISP